MAREFSSAYLAELGKSENQPIHLVELQLQGDTVRLTDAHKSVIYGMDEFTRAGHLLGIGDIEESSELNVSAMTVSLSGIDSTITSAFLGHQFHNRSLIVHKAFLDASDSLVYGAKVFEGKITEAGISDDPDGGTVSISVNASNHWSDFTRTSGRKTNTSDQQIHFPNDMGFEFADRTLEDIAWGRE
jgi:hypothetical protein